jgi:hypothetical protein
MKDKKFRDRLRARGPTRIEPPALCKHCGHRKALHKDLEGRTSCGLCGGFSGLNPNHEFE